MTLQLAWNENMANLPPMTAAIVLAAQLRHKLQLLQQTDISNPGGQTQQSLWTEVDDTFRYAFSVPPHLAASGYNHAPIPTFLHMCAPSSTILLHQAAEQAFARYVTPPSLIQSQSIRLAAAGVVASTMQLVSPIDVRLMHPFTGHCLFAATRVLMISLSIRADKGQQRQLVILLKAMDRLQEVYTATGGYFAHTSSQLPSHSCSTSEEADGIIELQVGV